MGVTGLWRLIEPAGKPVPVETLENKVLAVDISIWLHQMVKGYQDAKGAPLPNAHLIGLFQRLCKLLYFRIKPVFVFDGEFPDLKKETIAKRQGQKAKYNSESERLKRELVLILNKKTAISSLLGKKVSPTNQSSSVGKNDDDLFKLPELPSREEETESESEDEESSSGSIIDLHSVDLESDNFKSLPVKDKYDLLVELKETRKMNSWGKLHELPKKSDNFSDFQMQRLLKRRKVQECLAETEKEMGGNCMSLNELETLLNEEGIDTKFENIPSRRIASDNSTRFLLIKNVREAFEEAKRKKESKCNSGPSNIEENIETKCEDKTVKDELEDDLQKAIKMSLESECNSNSCNMEDNDDKNLECKLGENPAFDELEDDLQKAIKMSLECIDEPEISACSSKITDSRTDDSWTSAMSYSDNSQSDSEEDDGFQPPDMTCAKSYIMQYSDFTYKAIDKLVGQSKTKPRNKSSHTNVEQIIEELNQEKSIVTDNIIISSNDESMSDNENRNHNTSVSLNSTNDNILDSTKDSVFCIETPPNVITIDTSIEGSENNLNNDNSIIEVTPESDSNSEDDDFEEVSENMHHGKKSVVELTLQINDIAEEDDIFADVFSSTEIKKVHSISTTNTEIVTSDIKELKNTSHVNSKKEMPALTNIQELHNLEEKKNENNYKTDAMQVSKEIFAVDNEPDAEQNKVQDEELRNIQEVESEVVTNEKQKQVMSTETLITMEQEIESQEKDLIQEKGRLDRVGRNITEQMTKEAQELLQIFGIPYIVAPTEAEAQCAFLEHVKLTEGTITDDSDIWLFGGRTVYKNFFNQKKHVTQFLAERIERSFNLTREQLVLLALLVGSDYTIGINGIGPVTALEILASFPLKKYKLDGAAQHNYSQIVAGLKEFKQWVRTGKRTDNTSLRKKLKNIDVTEDFPSIRVVQAYLEPNIEKSDEKFSWGKFDITVLRDYTKSKFGWSQHKLDEIIKPVLKRMVDRNKQKTVHNYFKRKVEFQSLEDQMSKRVKAAVQKMGPETSEEHSTPKTTNRKRSAGKAGTSKVEQKRIKNVQSVAVVSTTNSDGGAAIEINIPKTDRVQEIIPQREKDKHSVLQNRMKAIEIYRKSKIDRKKKPLKRKPIQPKDTAQLSESSDSD